MMLNKSTLIVRRFVVFNEKGGVAYDQRFHKGVNIIRGNNSSGKSTISNMLFYALGGDFTTWNGATKQCVSVMAEVLINEEVITSKRFISDSKNQPMYLFWGTYDEAISSNGYGWKKYPYTQDGNTSFTNVLFNMLGYPEVKSDMYENTNVTMHQILRLLFVDQESKTSDLFRSEDFDKPLTREATAELLLGLYDNDLYQNRLKAKDLSKERDTKLSELRAIENLYSRLKSEINPISLNEELKKLESELSAIDNEITAKQLTTEYVSDNSQQTDIDNYLRQVSDLRAKYVSELDNFERLTADIEDSNYFIESLRLRIVGLEQSIATRDALGILPLTHCPQCLSPLPAVEDKNVCSLCHQPLPADKKSSAVGRIKQEIELQIKESLKTMAVKKRRLDDITISVKALKQQCESLQRDIDERVKHSKPTTNHDLNNLYEERGKIKQQITDTRKQIVIAERYIQLRTEIEESEKSLQYTLNTIKDKELELAERRDKALEMIYKFTAFLLRKDLSRQTEFSKASPDDVYINFKNNSMQFQGSFNYSASSNIYLKNSIRFAIFFSSILCDFFRFPRFILCDNIEDKGMEQARSQNFQQTLVDLSKELGDHEFQMIISTSMIKPELNINEYCIGPEYTAENKSLNLDD